MLQLGRLVCQAFRCCRTAGHTCGAVTAGWSTPATYSRITAIYSWYCLPWCCLPCKLHRVSLPILAHPAPPSASTPCHMMTSPCHMMTSCCECQRNVSWCHVLHLSLVQCHESSDHALHHFTIVCSWMCCSACVMEDARAYQRVL